MRRKLRNSNPLKGGATRQAEMSRALVVVEKNTKSAVFKGVKWKVSKLKLCM